MSLLQRSDGFFRESCKGSVTLVKSAEEKCTDTFLAAEIQV